MISKSLFLVLLFLTPNLAHADLPTKQDIDAAHEKCQTYVGVPELHDLTVTKCTFEVNVRALEQFVAAGHEGLEGNLRAARAGLAKTKQQIATVNKALAARPPAPPPPVSAPPPEEPRPREVVVVPPPALRVVSAAGQYAAATYDNQRWMSRVHFSGLPTAALHAFDPNAREPIDARLIVLKNGIPLAVSTPDGAEVLPIWVDINGDGRPEPQMMPAIDPNWVGSVYVQVLPQDDIQLIWVMGSGLYVEGGLETLPVWKPYARTRAVLRSQAARYEIFAMNMMRIN